MTIDLDTHELHCFVPMSTFGISSSKAYVYFTVAPLASKVIERSWKELRTIID